MSSLFDRRGHFAHRCARAWSWLILKTTGVRVRVEGLERITPGTTYVFVSNHQSIYDIPVIFASLPFQLRIIAKESLARFPVLGWHLQARRPSVRRSPHPDRAGILKRWRALVADGLSLIIFAEGTRSADGRVARFKAGSFLLAIEAGLPIVPLAVIGTRAGHAERPAAHRAGRRARWSSTIRFSRRRSTAPTVAGRQGAWPSESTRSLRTRWRNCRMAGLQNCRKASRNSVRRRSFLQSFLQSCNPAILQCM